MKALTLHQPWATLVALVVKTVETRSWSTRYRGPLLIHAGQRPPDLSLRLGPYGLGPHRIRYADHVDEGYTLTDTRGEPDGSGVTRYQTWPLPLGAVVATCTLTDVVPIIDWGLEDEIPDGPYVYADPDFIQVHDGPDDSAPLYLEDEVHYGDYRSGRYAWLLADVRPLPEPVPARGRQGLWAPAAELAAAGG